MEKKADTKFKPGQSGNPRGRKPGKLKSTILREQIAEHIPQIITVMTERALGGDVAASRLLLERCAPALKAIDPIEPFEIPDGNLVERAEAIVKATAAGLIIPQQASQLLMGLNTVAGLTQSEEIEKRLAALEERLNAAK
ncbi:DUF5681 domain-containing protein [Rhodoferax sp. GW822-FHT02A01]|uniref:DUF5681 domain-containing protein n=1 Tax=Rhodoferax sp. GW822-FHT02A01 TaxID=3141537 RepID=UPI00315C8773